MLSDLEIYAVVPASDLGRAREFYRDKLGLEPAQEVGEGLIYEGAGGTKFLLYETQFAGTAQNTAMNWATQDLDAEMAELRGRGVVFEDYDFPGFTTENGVLDSDDGRAAWFKDSEGNILALSEGM
ncbi:glyoxalase [Aeromicrobium sp. Root344]|uniref:VOC family protein n=1 Tax=Aeromicrobium sp. Root344 TaxID=1736521 RepID=UPI0006F3A9EA|nr:VOC family protein [Aeromicrobium sp. Root344]KQV76145.1 glyoxalase [Aeromicrobium sp. Root344]